MAWIIERSLTNYDQKLPIQSSNWKATSTFKAIYKFRILDDDNIVYYEGRSTSDMSFAPLDDYGQPNDGCTSIEYFSENLKVWEEL